MSIVNRILDSWPMNDPMGQPKLPWPLRAVLYPVALIGLGCLLLAECL